MNPVLAIPFTTSAACAGVTATGYSERALALVGRNIRIPCDAAESAAGR